MSKKKIAILGGGAGAMASAWGLTSKAGWADEYEITVYQRGWRLGGKGATGRELLDVPDAEPNERYNRLVEHGFHAWFGFYENAFSVIRECYAELGLDWQSSFLPHNRIVLAQEFRGESTPWFLDLTENSGSPGDGDQLPPAQTFVENVVETALAVWRQFRAGGPSETVRDATGIRSYATKPLEGGLHYALTAVERVVSPEQAYRLVLALLRARTLGGLGQRAGRRALGALLETAWALARRELEATVDTDVAAYRAYVSLEFMTANLRGILRDELFSGGFDRINDVEYSDWLRGLGTSQRTLDSVVVRACYDSCFAMFSKGDRNLEAGTLLRGMLRQLVLYKGSSLYHFAAGTGDTVFAPLFLALRQRGVRFEFFTNVEEIIAKDGVVESIRVERQRELAGDDYDPLMTIDGAPCWPAQPLEAQLVADDSAGPPDDLERQRAPRRGRVETLARGRDFDVVVCAISVGALEALTRTLCDQSSEWNDMVTRVKTIATQAAQLWFDRPLDEHGWKLGDALLSTAREPLDTYARLRGVLPAEKWPEPAPQDLYYLCGPLPDEPEGTSIDPEERRRDVRKYLEGWLEGRSPQLQPYAPGAFGPREGTAGVELDWSLLSDPSGATGRARLDAQFVRANVDPSERYVAAEAGTGKYRLRADRSGFANLFLAGDWTDNGINAGCMEAAFMSGLQASRGICGAPRVIVGEHDGLAGICSGVD